MTYTYNMKLLLLSISALAIFSGSTTTLKAQEATGISPIFITPYTAKQINRTPTIVHATSNTNAIRGNVRTYTQPGKKSSNLLYAEQKNPFANTGFGRIRAEKNYYDAEDKRHYNQYEYMGVLAKRGDTAKLQQVQQYLQQNGVYDPAKVQAAITNATQPQAFGSQQPSTTGGVQSTYTGTTFKQPTYKIKTQTTSVPQRLHGGYDDAENQTLDPAEAIKPTGPRPIFLR